jgi:hypothetical protein
MKWGEAGSERFRSNARFCRRMDRQHGGGMQVGGVDAPAEGDFGCNGQNTMSNLAGSIGIGLETINGVLAVGHEGKRLTTPRIVLCKLSPFP